MSYWRDTSVKRSGGEALPERCSTCSKGKWFDNVTWGGAKRSHKPLPMVASSDPATFEKFHQAGLQRVLRTHYAKASFLDQLFQHLGPVSQVVHRGPDVGAHRLLDQGIAIMSQWGGQEALHRRPHPVHDRPEIAGLIFGGTLQLLQRGENGAALRVA